MAGGDDDARDGVQMAHRIGQNRHRTQFVKQIDVNTLMAQHQSRRFGEFRAHPAGVIRDDHAALSVLFALAVDVVGEALRRAADVVEVHAVRARAEYAAHARRAKGQLGIESILDFLFVAGNRLQLIDRRLIRGKFFKPCFVCFTIIHVFYPPSLL